MNINADNVITMPKLWIIKNANQDKQIIIDFINNNFVDLILDFSQTEFIDSTGLGVLVAILKACKQQEKELLLCQLSPKVEAIIELTQLQKIFKIFPDILQAKTYLDD